MVWAFVTVIALNIASDIEEKHIFFYVHLRTTDKAYNAV